MFFIVIYYFTFFRVNEKFINYTYEIKGYVNIIISILIYVFII